MDGGFSGMKVLMVGVGGIAQRHMRNLQAKFNNVQFIAYRKLRRKTVVTEDLQVEENVNVEEKFNLEVFEDLNEALAQKPEIAFICNPNNAHIPTAIEAARAGCHLFIEKPLSHSLEGVDELMQIVDEKQLIAFVAFQLRYHPGYQLLQEKLKSGVIGDLISVRAEVGEYLPGWHKYEDYREMYAARKDLGGGVVITQIHELDYLYGLFGRPEKIMACGGQLSDLEVDVEDSVDILMQFKYKTRILPVSVHMDYVQRPPSRYCRIIGTRGVLTLDFVQTVLMFVSSEGKKEEISFKDFNRNQMFIDELNHFFECMDTKKQPLTDLKAGKVSLEMAINIQKEIGYV